MLTRLIGTVSAAHLTASALADQIFEAAASSVSNSNTTAPTCEQQPFCDRFRQLMDHNDLRMDSDVYYSVDEQTVAGDASQGQITATLNLASTTDGTVAQKLSLTLTVYQNGIMRMLVEEPETKRFRISQETLHPVVDEQLIPVDLTDKITWSDDRTTLTISGLEHEEGDEGWEYTLELPRFRINQLSGDGKVQTLVVNPEDTLYFETESTSTLVAPHLYGVGVEPTHDDIATLKEKISADVGRDVYRAIPPSEASSLLGGVNRGIGLGFFMPSVDLFGLGEREDTLVLKRTTGTNPYEMWAFDCLHHNPDSMTGLYGNMPYVQGIGSSTSQAVTWMNSAHTWVFLDDATYEGQAGSNINFLSETGAIELFLFSSSVKTKSGSLNRNKRVTNDLTTVTGFAPLPPLHTLGFHFSKYNVVSSDIMMERSRNFTDYQFPVDVLVMDIQWADQNSESDYVEYFQFNPQNFTADGLAQMNAEIEASGRYITTILDPHIKVSSDYFVYAEGQELQEESTSTAVNSIFVKDETAGADYEALCWPGNSVWIDFLSEIGQNFWASMFNYDKFKGSTKIYHAWNDMNEPSIFSSDEKTESLTLPTTTKHIRPSGEVVEHREFHNAYGASQQMMSYKGLVERDQGMLRPFVLTRSYFIGSQKYGAYWTGDNYSIDEEIYGA